MKSSGKRVNIALHGLIEDLGLDFVQLGQVAIQHHFLIANKVDFPLDAFDGS